jgi:hypothetical protein
MPRLDLSFCSGFLPTIAGPGAGVWLLGTFVAIVIEALGHPSSQIHLDFEASLDTQPSIDVKTPTF